MAKFYHHFYKLPLQNLTFNKIISFVGPFTKKSSILVYNSPMGIFTQKMIKGNFLFKQIDIANQSKEEVKIFKEKIHSNEREHVNIHLLKTLKIPKKARKVDAFISFNDLGYVKDIPAFVNEVKNVLNKKGKFCFYIRNHLLDMTPNAIEIENKKDIIKIFKNEKLKVNYKVKKKLLKTEIFIYGEKV